MMMQTCKKRNCKFYFLIAIFIIPMIGSWFLYFFHDHIQFKTTNRGTLVAPPIQTQTIWKNPVNHTWQIVYVPGDCQNEQCEKILFHLSQMRKLLGKDYRRVSLVLITKQKYAAKSESKFHNEIFSQSQVIQFNQALSEKNGKDFIANDKIYLIDPIGNLFMYYASTVNPLDILKDIKHLLGVSQIG